MCRGLCCLFSGNKVTERWGPHAAYSIQHTVTMVIIRETCSIQTVQLFCPSGLLLTIVNKIGLFFSLLFFRLFHARCILIRLYIFFPFFFDWTGRQHWVVEGFCLLTSRCKLASPSLVSRVDPCHLPPECWSNGARYAPGGRENVGALPPAAEPFTRNHSTVA